jgi:hypothetical protein
MEKNYIIIDGYAMSILHPDTFLIPSEEEINSLKVGDFVKIDVNSLDDEAWESKPYEDIPEADRERLNITPGRGIRSKGEKFWTEVLTIEGDIITGRVINDLVFSEKHNLHWGDIMEYKKKNILQMQRN